MDIIKTRRCFWFSEIHLDGATEKPDGCEQKQTYLHDSLS
jgi:hypothetical protein